MRAATPEEQGRNSLEEGEFGDREGHIQDEEVKGILGKRTSAEVRIFQKLVTDLIQTENDVKPLSLEEALEREL